MPDNIPIHPTSADISIVTEYRDLQKEIGESFFKQQTSIYKIVDLEKSLNKGLIQRLIRQRDLQKDIKSTQNALIKAQENYNLSLGKANEKNAKDTMESIKKDLSGYQAEYLMLDKINKLALMPMIWFLKQTFELFKSMDATAAAFRLKMGMFRDSLGSIRSLTQKIAVDFMHVGVTIEGAYNAISELGDEMGSIYLAGEKLVKTTALLKSQLGISEETTAGFLRNMSGIAKTTMESQENLTLTAAALSQAAGVPLNLVMGDVAKMSTQTLSMVSRYPGQILRAAIEARRLNTTLNDTARAGKEILNFSDSINSEMEASVLLGRSINLQHARELAYRRDLTELNKEILRIAKSVNMEQLDEFQMQAFARATGRSVEELTKMLQAEKQWDAARRSADPEIRKMVQNYDRLLESNNAGLKSRENDIKLMLMQQNNQQRLIAITQKWNQILAKASEALLPILDILLSLAPPLMDLIPIAAPLVGIFSKIGSILSGKIFNSMLKLYTMGASSLTIFDKVFITIGKISTFFGKFLGGASKLGAFLAPLAKWLSPFIKIMGPIGWIITAFSAISGAIRGWNSATGNFASKLGGAVMGALRAIIPGFDWIVEKVKWLAGAFVPIKNAIIDAFSGAWKWVKSLWGGNSPSQVGLSIVKGIVSVGTMLFDALTSPWRKALAWIFDYIPGMGKVAERLRGGLTDIINKPVETRAVATYTPVIQVTPNETKIANTPPPKPMEEAEKSSTNESGKLLQNILEAINNLNKNLESGKIGFYVDSQLLSATISRQTEFRSGYGVNKI